MYGYFLYILTRVYSFQLNDATESRAEIKQGGFGKLKANAQAEQFSEVAEKQISLTKAKDIEKKFAHPFAQKFYFESIARRTKKAKGL
jgi:hypothetical protein